MRNILFVLLFVTTICNAQQHQLDKLWETDAVVAVPESVLPVGNMLYVSLINGNGWEADGKGGIAKLSLDGKQLDSTWINGLNAPKGLGKFGNRLYTADISEVVIINIPEGKIEKKITIDGATGLNDITINQAGIVYVSDSRKGKIWKIENDKLSLYLDSVKGVNGLKAIGSDLYIGAGKSFIKADVQKKITTITEMPAGIDGIEPVGNGDFLLTAWNGYIWYVYADGRFETLLETYQQKKNTADLGFDQKNQILYVPTFNAKTVMSYHLK